MINPKAWLFGEGEWRTSNIRGQLIHYTISNGCKLSVSSMDEENHHRLITYTLQVESGASLRGAGFKVAGEVKPGEWDRIDRAREYQPIYGQLKFRWEKTA